MRQIQRRRSFTVLALQSLLPLSLSLAILSPTRCHAQSTGELLKILILDMEKLAELKAILKGMYRGYEVLDQGYTNIRNIAHNSFDLHQAFLDALLAVTPEVRQYSPALDVLQTEQRLLAEYKAGSRKLQASGYFTPTEMQVINSVYGNILAAGSSDVEELKRVLTPGELRMSDAERMQAIDRIDKDIGKQLSWLRQFNQVGTIQVWQRAKEINDLSTLRQLYGFP